MIKREYGGRSRLPLKDILDRAIELMGRDRALSWWMKPTDVFGGESPYKLCSSDKQRKVMDWLDMLDMAG